MSWVRSISAERARSAERTPPPPSAATPPARAAKVAPVDLLQVARPAKAPDLAGLCPKIASADLAAITRLTERLEPHRRAQLERTLGALYQRLGKDLARLPPHAQSAAASASVRALRGLLDALPHEELLGPAVSTFADLVRYATQPVKAQPAADGRAFAAAATAAREVVLGLASALEGRAGAAGAITVLPNLVWQAERAGPPAGAERWAGWRSMAELVADALPRSTIEQLDLANLSAAVAEELTGDRPEQVRPPAAPAPLTARFTGELSKQPADVRGALERAKVKIHLAAQPALQPARDALARAPEGVAAGTPAHAAWTALSQAMQAVLVANPAGPSALGAALEALADRAGVLAASVDATTAPAWRALAEVLAESAASPSAEPLAWFLTFNLEVLAASPAARAVLAEVGAADATTLTRALLSAQAARVGEARVTHVGDAPAPEPAAVDAALFAALDALPEVLRLQVTVAALPFLERSAVARPVLAALAGYAAAAPTAGQEQLERFAQRFAVAHAPLLEVLGEPRAGQVAAAAARAALATPLETPEAAELAALCADLVAVAPRLDLAALVADDRLGRPGLFTLSRTESYRFDPRPMLEPLVSAVKSARVPASAEVELVRHALHVAGELGKLDRAPGPVVQRVVEDWSKGQRDPAQLHFATRAGSMVALRASGPSPASARAGARATEPAVTRFLREHRELPPELAFTAAVHLANDELTWLTSTIAATRSRAQVRNLRDALFAAVEGGGVELFAALRTSTSGSAAIARATAFVAAEYRGGRLADLPWATLVDGLRAGVDPVQQITDARDGAAIASLGVAALAHPDPEGLATLGRVQADLAGILSTIPPDAQAYGAPSARLREPFLACLRAVAEGTWPRVKYEGPIADRILAKLTDAQRALWTSELVTPLASRDRPPPGPELLEALTLAKGLAPALKLEVHLQAPGLPALGFDARSRALARAELVRLGDALHQVPKGTAEHRALSKQLGPIAACAAILDLSAALDRLGDDGAADPAQALAGLRDLLTAAEPAARRLGARGCYEAITRVREVIPEGSTSPRAGYYAADEDHLDAYVTAFDAGCMAAKDGANAGGQVELITSPQYKVLRVVNGDVGVTRSMLRLVDAKLPGYDGPALWVDGPYPINRGAQATPELYELAYRHALNKAQAMGVPLLFGTVGYGEGRFAGPAAMAAAGAEPAEHDVEVTFDRGVTGLHHAQSFLGDRHYWVCWGYQVGYASQPEDQQTMTSTITAQVVLPG